MSVMFKSENKTGRQKIKIMFTTHAHLPLELVDYTQCQQAAYSFDYGSELYTVVDFNLFQVCVRPCPAHCHNYTFDIFEIPVRLSSPLSLDTIEMKVLALCWFDTRPGRPNFSSSCARDGLSSDVGSHENAMPE